MIKLNNKTELYQFVSIKRDSLQLQGPRLGRGVQIIPLVRVRAKISTAAEESTPEEARGHEETLSQLQGTQQLWRPLPAPAGLIKSLRWEEASILLPRGLRAGQECRGNLNAGLGEPCRHRV